MELYRLVVGRNDTRPHISRSTVLYGQRKRFKNTCDFPVRRGLPFTPRRPIFWSLFSRKSKRVWLLEKKRHEETLGTAGLKLYLALSKVRAFDFIGQIADGNTLLVGEGNLSFTVSLTRDKRIVPGRLTATLHEYISELSVAARENATKLRALGVHIFYDVDATKLSLALGGASFDNIVFQFPNVGSREPIEGRNPNFILIRDFLKCAIRHLPRGGKVLISAVDNPYYRGAFQFEKAAEEAGFSPPQSYSFDPSQFRGYHHTMTHQPGNALGNHDEFATWIFRPKS